MLYPLQRILIFGLLGMLVECFFTGAHSLLTRNWKATCTSYLYMIPIYGLAGITLDALHSKLALHPIYAAMIYVPVIYIFEFCFGWLLQKIIKVCPWHYGHGKFTIMGLVRIDYAPLWFLLALCFDSLSNYMTKLFKLMSGI